MNTHRLADELMALARWAREAFDRGIEWAETHCWKCNSEVGDYEDGDKCPSCGADLVPF